MFDPLSGGTIETVRAVLMLKRLKAFDWNFGLKREDTIGGKLPARKADQRVQSIGVVETLKLELCDWCFAIGTLRLELWRLNLSIRTLELKLGSSERWSGSLGRNLLKFNLKADELDEVRRRFVLCRILSSDSSGFK